MTAILPLAETQFVDANGAPLAAGTVDFYVPGTTTRKDTYQDSSGTLNTNPVVLDAAGRAIIWGSGSYRQIVKDSSGNLIWDQVITAPYVASNVVITIATLADLQAEVADHDGQIIYRSDIQANYKWNATSTATADGVTIVAVTGVTTGRWELQHEGTLWLSYFGAKFDGVTDDSAAVQAAIDYLNVTNGTDQTQTVRIMGNPGTAIIGSQILGANSLSNFEFGGCGKQVTIFQWAGSAGVSMFKLRNSARPYFHDLAIVGDSTAQPSFLLEFNVTSGKVGTAATGRPVLQHIIFGGSSVTADSAIGFTADSGYDNNNDKADIYDVEFNNFASYGAHIQGANSLWHEFRGSRFYNCGIAAISTLGNANSAVTNMGGGYSAYGCRSEQCASTFEFGPGAFHNISIHGWESESDNAFIAMPLSASDTVHSLNVSLFGASYKGSDGNVITFDAGENSTLGLYGCKLKSPSGPALDFPTTGSRVLIEGGESNISAITYNNEVVIRNHRNESNPTYTNSGSGTLDVTDRGAGTAEVDTIPEFSSATTIDINGLSSHYIKLNFATASTLATITGGNPGDIIVLESRTANVTLAYGYSTNQINLLKHANWAMPQYAKIVLVKSDVTDNYNWRQVAVTVPPGSVTALTDSTGGTASSTINDVGTTFSQTILNNNFASIAANQKAIIQLLEGAQLD